MVRRRAWRRVLLVYGAVAAVVLWLAQADRKILVGMLVFTAVALPVVWAVLFTPLAGSESGPPGRVGGRRRRPPLSDDLRRQLESVEPSRGELAYWPCEATLDDGTVRDCVYVQNSKRWFPVWGVDPEDDQGKRSVPIERVVAIRESPTRLPPRFANKMYDAGESGMGGCFFRLVLRDGRHLDCASGNAVDFPTWPEGVAPSDVVDLVPHAGERSMARPGRDYAWALYE
jgi:hypothetical protein